MDGEVVCYRREQFVAAKPDNTGQHVRVFFFLLFLLNKSKT